MVTEQNKSKKNYSYILLILLLTTLVACQLEPVSDMLVNVTNESPIVTTETSLPVVTQESIPAISTRRSIVAVETDLPVVTREFISDTPTYQPITTDTTQPLIPSPIPILSLKEKKAVASALYLTNANCELPCWWGIIPGETEWKTARLFLSTIATRITTGTQQSEFDPEFVAEVDIPVPDDLSEIGFLRHQFVVNDGVIVNIRLEAPWGTRKIDTISEILNIYGYPTEVWLDTIGYTFGEYYPFRIVLFYPEKGFLIKYSDRAELTENHIIGCPQNKSGKLWLWSPNPEFISIESFGKHRGEYYKPLEEVSEIDAETFYQTYLDPDTETCIETPAELWMDR